MMKDIHEEIISLGEFIKSRDVISKIKEIEDKMEQDEEFIRLVNLYSEAQSEYSHALDHYDDGSEELKTYLKKLHEIKTKVDTYPLSIEYYKLLSEINEPLHYLEFNLLNRFKDKSSCEEDRSL